MAGTDGRTRYRRLLVEEFARLGIAAKNYRAEARRECFEQLLDEIVVTAFPHVHEGRAATYGAIIATKAPERFCDAYAPAKPRFFPDTTESSSRMLADGYRSFFARLHGVPGVLSFDAPLTTDFELFQLRDVGLFHDADCSPYPFEACPEELMIVRRQVDGTIVVFVPEGVLSTRNNIWSFHPYQYAVLKALVRGTPFMSDEMAAALKPVLRVSIHIIGAMPGVGATLVQLAADDEGCLAGPLAGSTTIVNLQNAVEFPWHEELQNATSMHHPLVHLLSHYDGAAIIDHTGRVRYVRAWLTPPSAAIQSRTSAGGTRHLTAAAFSEQIEGFVCVASSDGPVTVFQGGEPLVTTSSIKPADARVRR